MNSWYPFNDRIKFDFAHFHFVEAQSSAAEINRSLDHWRATLLKYGDAPRWANSKKVYETIDQVQYGSAPWKVVQLRYQGPLPTGNPPKWMTQAYKLCLRDAKTILTHQLQTPEFRTSDQVNRVLYRQFGDK